MLLFFKNHFVLFWSFTCETWQGYLEDSSAQGGGARPEGPDPCQPDPVSLLTVPSPGPLLVAREPRMDSCMQTDEEMQNYINCLFSHYSTSFLASTTFYLLNGTIKSLLWPKKPRKPCLRAQH